ncbi:hypothetical protein [Dyadobacter sp. BHUBP1]|uniref:hypothetical protein n=1 Tax=Dyadobacter sp. BHUBP1 TaxID=3424178 RepID=UPI003D350EF5
MKLFKIGGNVFKYLLLIGILTACNHDEPVSPASNSTTGVNEENAKTNAALKLVKYGDDGVQYIKSGKFMGMLYRVSNATTYRKYTYNDNNGTTNLFITCTSYSQATNAKIGESIYEIANGRCIAVTGSNGDSCQYKYNASGLLDEVTMFYQSSWAKWNYSYIFNAPTNAYRLDKIVAINNAGPVQEAKFTYTAIADKYPLNPENINTEPLLPFFGKFSDVLIKDIEIKSTSGTQWTNFREYNYVLDNAGYVTSRTQAYHPFGKGSNQSLSTSTMNFKYSQYWQGI